MFALENLNLSIVFQIANPTVLEKPGAFMLAPVYKLLFVYTDYLCLNEDQIIISYKTYKSDKPSDMKKITVNRLAPGEKFSNSKTI